jgi:RNA polymerase-binding protein DksA
VSKVAKKTNPKSGRKKETKKPPSSAVKKKKKAPGAKRPQNHRSKVSRSSKTVSQKPVRKKKPSGRTSAKNRSYLTPQELEHYRAILLEKLQEITGDVHWLEKEGLHKSRQNSTGDLSTMPIHMADIGTDTYEQEFSLGLMDSERKMVREILDALKRIEQGTYGICEGTGKPIPKGRLEANPWARYCVEYASLLEQGKVIEHRYSGPARFADGLGEEEEEEETEADETPEEEEMDLEENEIDGNVGFDEEELEEEEETFF